MVAVRFVTSLCWEVMRQFKMCLDHEDHAYIAVLLGISFFENRLVIIRDGLFKSEFRFPNFLFYPYSYILTFLLIHLLGFNVFIWTWADAFPMFLTSHSPEQWAKVNLSSFFFYKSLTYTYAVAQTIE